MIPTRVAAIAAALGNLADKACPNAHSDVVHVQIRASDLKVLTDYIGTGVALENSGGVLSVPQDLDAVCSRACTTWSAQSQEDVAIGEIGELLTLFGRRAAKRDTHEEWVDEIADVIIMMHQLAFLRGRADVSKRIAEKIERIKLRLDSIEIKG